MVRIRILIGCIAFISLALPAFAQPNLLVNGSIEGSYTTQMVLSCSTFINMNGCYASHGTPQIGGAGAPDGTQFAHMWYEFDNTWGEGVALTMKDFTIDRCEYNISFWYRTDNDPGTITFGLTTNPPQSAFNMCGDPIPAFAPFQQIPLGVLPPAPNWTFFVSPTFTANATGYNTLVIYPQNAVANQVFQLDVDGIELYNCESSLIVDHLFAPPPAGFYKRSDFIKAGSMLTFPGSTTPVSPNPNVNTTFRAGDYVLLTDNFLSQPTTGSFFLAEIGQCTFCNGDPNKLAEGDTGFGTHSDQPKFSLSPNPTTGHFTIEKTRDAEATISVFDLYGKTVIEKEVMSGNTAEIDLSNQPHGTYLVQLQSAGTVQTMRLIKQ